MSIIPFPSNANWQLFTEEQNNHWGRAKPDDIILVLEFVKFVFEKYIDKSNINNKPLKLQYSNDGPICYRELGLIQLKAKNENWAEFAYQFAHELCHFAIIAPVYDKIRWFEETICETASLFILLALEHISNDKNNSPYPQLHDYAPCFTEYIDNMLNLLLYPEPTPLNIKEYTIICDMILEPG